MSACGISTTATILSALVYLPSQVRALPLLPLLPRATSKADYISNAMNATGVLNEWYNSTIGQWQYYNTTDSQWQSLWWNSANVVTTLACLAQVNSNYTGTANGMLEDVFIAAQASNGGSWLNDYYDDEGWWALAWIKAFDMTNNGTYLSAAETIFEDLKGGTNASCGGQWWDKNHTAVNSINNELYLAVGASLANRVSGKQSYYGAYATNQADWLLGAGLMNSNSTFVDGFTVPGCAPEGDFWSYNQGVILGALVEMNKLTNNSTYLNTAAAIAQGTLDHLTTNGILIDSGAPSGEDTTSAQFKGVFARNLATLQNARGDGNYVTFLQTNADSIWSNDRQSDGQIGVEWQGPVTNTNAAAQSSALDCLVAAAAVSS